MNFSYEVDENGFMTVFFNTKRVDANIAVRFKEQFRERMSDHVQNGKNVFIFEISNVEFIDSSGLGAIVSCLKMVGRDGNIVIVGPGPNVMDLFKLTRMDRVFQIFENLNDAVNYLNL